MVTTNCCVRWGKGESPRRSSGHSPQVTLIARTGPMPELPEVETVVRGLRRHILNDTLRRVRFASLRISRANLRGWKRQLTGHAVTSITRRGKFILVGLSDDHTMVIHLRMTGRLWVKPLPYRRGPYDRCVIELASGRALILADTRQFARVQWVGPGRLDTHPSLEILGP
ncbi:MAG: hypothetical protein GF341_02885, partial [candidate division Zixibacteria bacterium]|nr:hypothetical protein [candidate division Zixibacteria bacterium]